MTRLNQIYNHNCIGKRASRFFPKNNYKRPKKAPDIYGTYEIYGTRMGSGEQGENKRVRML